MKNTTTLDPNVYSIKQALHVLWSGKHIILGFTIAFFAIGLIYNHFGPPDYKRVQVNYKLMMEPPRGIFCNEETGRFSGVRCLGFLGQFSEAIGPEWEIDPVFDYIYLNTANPLAEEVYLANLKNSLNSFNESVFDEARLIYSWMRDNKELFRGSENGVSTLIGVRRLLTYEARGKDFLKFHSIKIERIHASLFELLLALSILGALVGMGVTLINSSSRS